MVLFLDGRVGLSVVYNISQGGGRTGKRDQHLLFFFGALPDTLPTPTFLIEYIFPTDMFSVIFFGDCYKT
jgi:hypothetical protein